MRASVLNPVVAAGRNIVSKLSMRTGDAPSQHATSPFRYNNHTRTILPLLKRGPAFSNSFHKHATSHVFRVEPANKRTPAAPPSNHFLSIHIPAKIGWDPASQRPVNIAHSTRFPFFTDLTMLMIYVRN